MAAVATMPDDMDWSNIGHVRTVTARMVREMRRLRALDTQDD